jgi:hypothetical protein
VYLEKLKAAQQLQRNLKQQKITAYAKLIREDRKAKRSQRKPAMESTTPKEKKVSDDEKLTAIAKAFLKNIDVHLLKPRPLDDISNPVTNKPK